MYRLMWSLCHRTVSYGDLAHCYDDVGRCVGAPCISLCPSCAPLLLFLYLPLFSRPRHSGKVPALWIPSHAFMLKCGCYLWNSILNDEGLAFFANLVGMLTFKSILSKTDTVEVCTISQSCPLLPVLKQKLLHGFHKQSSSRKSIRKVISPICWSKLGNWGDLRLDRMEKVHTHWLMSDKSVGVINELKLAMWAGSFSCWSGIVFASKLPCLVPWETT